MVDPTVKWTPYEDRDGYMGTAGEGISFACPVPGCGAWPGVPCNRRDNLRSVSRNHRGRERIWAGWSELQRVAWTALWNEKQRTRHD